MELSYRSDRASKRHNNPGQCGILDTRRGWWNRRTYGVGITVIVILSTEYMCAVAPRHTAPEASYPRQSSRHQRRLQPRLTQCHPSDRQAGRTGRLRCQLLLSSRRLVGVYTHTPRITWMAVGVELDAHAFFLDEGKLVLHVGRHHGPQLPLLRRRQAAGAPPPAAIARARLLQAGAVVAARRIGNS